MAAGATLAPSNIAAPQHVGKAYIRGGRLVGWGGLDSWFRRLLKAKSCYGRPGTEYARPGPKNVSFAISNQISGLYIEFYI